MSSTQQLIDRRLAWSALAGVGLLSLAACLRRIWAADFWWQYASGRVIAESGWPVHDLFSFTAPDAPWIELRWIFCLGQYWLMESLGAPSLVVLKWLLVVAAFSLISLPVFRRADPVALAGVLAVALLAASQRFFVRPELLTYLLFAAFVWILDRHRRTGGRLIYLLPVLQVLWVNAHPLFVFGPLLVGLLLFVSVGRAWIGTTGNERRAQLRGLLPLAGVLAATILAGLLNPYGLDGLRLPFQLFGEMRASIFKEAIGELKSPFGFGGMYVAVFYYKVLIGLCALSALLNIRRLDPFWLLLCLSQLYLSALAIRSLPLFCLVAVPFVLDNLARSEFRSLLPASIGLPLRRVAAVGILGICLWYSLSMFTDRFNARQNDSNQFGVSIADHRYPVGAADYLERAGLGGRVLGGLLESSYLLTRGFRVFVDPRLEIYGEAIFERFLALHTDPAKLDAAVREYDIGLAVVELRSPLVALLGRSPDWMLAYFDEVAAVFVRGDRAEGLEPIDSAKEFRKVADRLRLELPEPVPYDDAGWFNRVAPARPFLSLADFFLLTGQAEMAESFLDDAVMVSPWLERVPHRRMSLMELRGDLRGVVEQAQLALVETPAEPRLLFKLGESYVRLGEPEQARGWLEQSLEVEPDRAVTWALLGQLHIGRAEFVEAEAAFTRAVDLSPETAVYLSNLGRVRARLGKNTEAIDGLQRALALSPDNATVMRDLVHLYLTQGDIDRARPLLLRALALAPEDPDLQLLLGVVENAVTNPR